MPMMADGGCWDDANGGTLHTGKVKDARRQDIEFIANRRVYDIVPWRQPLERIGTSPINNNTRWVDTNKGSEDAPNYRSRWVAQELRRGPDHALYASTPPLGAIRSMVSDVASGHGVARSARLGAIGRGRVRLCAKTRMCSG